MPRNYRSVLFIGSGNVYRSRFCEYYFNAVAKVRGLYWRATSRGLRTRAAVTAGPISELAAYRLTALGVPYDQVRTPIPLAEVDLEDADFVVAVKMSEHLALMQKQFPAWADRITYWHINGLDWASADEALPMCEANIEDLIDGLLVKQRQEAPSKPLRAA